MPILPFERAVDVPDPPTLPDRQRGPRWQRQQAAAICALHACEEHLVGTGVPRRVARVFSRACIRAFLQDLAGRAAHTSVVDTFDVVDDFIALVYQNPYRDDDPGA